MSMYNMLFGFNQLSELFLTILELDPNEIPRFRDAYWDGDKIVIYTRTGGGNRDDYEGGNGWLASLPYYISDEDDDYDNTYAKFYYSLPPKFEHIRSWLNDRISEKPSERWEDLFTKLDSGDQSDPTVKKALEFGKELAAKIDQTLK